VSKILERQKAYVIDYPVATEFAEKQEEIFWTSTEIEMEKDLQDLHNSLQKQSCMVLSLY